MTASHPSRTAAQPFPTVLANQEAIVAGIRTAAPDAQLVIQSVMPRALKYRSRIETLNERYRALAEEHDATYLDLWPALSDGHGALKPGYSLDRLHLNGAGYRAWVSELRPYVSA
ncbi:GDSL-type esterase/lipase family protein [Promicromonospora soli]